jgi:hypothetical protein
MQGDGLAHMALSGLGPQRLACSAIVVFKALFAP